MGSRGRPSKQQRRARTSAATWARQQGQGQAQAQEGQQQEEEEQQQSSASQPEVAHLQQQMAALQQVQLDETVRVRTTTTTRNINTKTTTTTTEVSRRKTPSPPPQESSTDPLQGAPREQQADARRRRGQQANTSRREQQANTSRAPPQQANTSRREQQANTSRAPPPPPPHQQQRAQSPVQHESSTESGGDDDAGRAESSAARESASAAIDPPRVQHRVSTPNNLPPHARSLADRKSPLQAAAAPRARAALSTQAPAPAPQEESSFDPLQITPATPPRQAPANVRQRPQANIGVPRSASPPLLSLPDRSRQTPRSASRSASRERRLREDESPIDRARKVRAEASTRPQRAAASPPGQRQSQRRERRQRATPARFTQELLDEDEVEDAAPQVTQQTPRRQRPTQEELRPPTQDAEVNTIPYYQALPGPGSDLAAPAHSVAREPMRANLEYRQISGRLDCRCVHCHALHWLEERTTNSPASRPAFRCCMDGQVDLLVTEYPPALRRLFDRTEQAASGIRRRTRECEDLMRGIRHMNNAFAFCSQGGNIDQSILDGRGQGGSYTFRLHGAIYHRIGSLLPPPGQRPSFAQLYVFDGQEEQAQRRREAFDNLDLTVARVIQSELNRHHPFVRGFVKVAEWARGTSAGHIRLTLGDDRGQDPNRYNPPSVDEVAMLILEPPTEANSRDLIVMTRDGTLRRIVEWKKEYISLRYPFIHARGEPGWHDEIPLAGQREGEGFADDEMGATPARRGRNGSERVTQKQWYLFHLQIRGGETPALLLMGRLLHEWMVDAYAAMEQNRLNWLRQNQATLRSAIYEGLVDALALNDRVAANDVGMPVMLPASHMGSPRQMKEAYLDAMTIARTYGPPDFFVTITCNPRWIEVTRELHPGQAPSDRPDLLNRVFKMKLTRLTHELTRNHVLGRVVGWCYSIEFQKRGLPHAHIILTLAPGDRLHTAAQMDAVVRADIPDPEQEPLLHDVVRRFMVHKVCGDENPRAPCMRNGQCRFHFPYELREETHVTDRSYPMYRRPDNGRTLALHGDDHTYTNRDIASYNPYLSVRFNAHINVQVVSSFQSIKYAFKYIFKGPDRAAVAIGDPPGEGAASQQDEIQQFLDARYVAASEAHWRLSGYKTHDHWPTVVKLAVHLPGQHTVALRDGEDVAAAVRRGGEGRTTLTEFFKANLEHRQAMAGVENPAPGPTDLLYQDFPGQYTWNVTQKRWMPRSRGFALGRVVYVSPSQGERYYLRLLLISGAGYTSFEDVRTWEGTLHPTFQAACIARGLLLDDGEYVEALREAAVTQMGPQIRELFATILIQCVPADPRRLWEQTKDAISEDCAYILRTRMNVPEPTEQDAFDLALCYIRDLLYRQEKDLSDFDLPFPERNFTAEISADGNRLIHFETSYDTEQLQREVEQSVPRMNPDQRRAYDALVAAVEAGEGGTFFVDGPGGTGKTFLQATTLAHLRSQGKIALATATSGIAATLLPGGTTAHSRFKIPVPTKFDSVCGVSKRTHLAALIQRTELVFWDEAVMAHRFCMEAVDRMFRDVRDDPRTFGGCVFCFCGDFRQTLPVVQHGSPAEIVRACLKRSSLWDGVVQMRLTINMRLQRPGMLPAERERVARFADTLLDVGNGTATGPDGRVQWTTADLVPQNTPAALAERLFPGLESAPSPVYDPTAPDLLRGRAVLAPTNARVMDLNNLLVARMHGEARVNHSTDVPDPETCAVSFPIENLNAMNDASLPPHRLVLKVGCPVILLRNLDPANGLCNGTRLRVERMDRKILHCRILAGTREGALCYLPRIPLESPDMGDGCKFKRHQWPVKLAFAMTVNKSQGQSLSFVGLLLEPEVFGHGQLYVALSRVTTPDGIRMVTPNTDLGRAGRIKNVVYADVFN